MIRRWPMSSPIGSRRRARSAPLILTKESKRAPDDPGLDRILRAAVKNDFPVSVLFWDNIEAGTALIDRHPDARFIIALPSGAAKPV
jgi:hypothetical protein